MFARTFVTRVSEPPLTAYFRNSAYCALLAICLLAIPAAVFAIDYPPPPGSYSSEPLALTPSTRAILETETRKTPANQPSSSRLLPLPMNEKNPPGGYDADVLFGAAKTPQPATQPKAPSGSDFSMDFSREPKPGYGPTPPTYGTEPYWNQTPYYSPGTSSYTPEYRGTPSYGPNTTQPTSPSTFPSQDPQLTYPQYYDYGAPPQVMHPPPVDPGLTPQPMFRPPYE